MTKHPTEAVSLVQLSAEGEEQLRLRLAPPVSSRQLRPRAGSSGILCTSHEASMDLGLRGSPAGLVFAAGDERLGTPRLLGLLLRLGRLG